MFKLPALPYAQDALAPTLSARTLKFHHDKHHAHYIDTLNALLAGKPAPASLEALIVATSPAADAKLFNNAAQSWNHAFYWVSMTPAPVHPKAALADAIVRSFGSHDALKTAFVAAGEGHFGSGWLWLAADASGALSLRATHDAGCLLTTPSLRPLLVCDLWEHGYYLDWQNDRAGYLGGWFDTVANWTLASTQLQGGKAGWRFPTD